jgi:hypothetical protein
MPLHVDIIENQWSAGYQQRVARVWVADAHVEVEGDDHWFNLVHQVMEHSGAGSPEADLDAIAEHFKGDYAHATVPHGDDACPFAGGDRLPFEAESSRTREAHAARV